MLVNHVFLKNCDSSNYSIFRFVLPRCIIITALLRYRIVQFIDGGKIDRFNA